MKREPTSRYTIHTVGQQAVVLLKSLIGGNDDPITLHFNSSAIRQGDWTSVHRPTGSRDHQLWYAEQPYGKPALTDLHLSRETNFPILFGSLISLVHLSAPLCPQAPTMNRLSTCLMVCSILGSRPISFPTLFLLSSPLSHGLITW